MFDFPMTDFNIGAALYCIIFYLIILCSNYKRGIYKPLNYSVSLKYQKKILFWIAFFIVTHCLNGDFYHLMENVHEYDFTPDAYNYGEPIYVEIAKIVNRNYFLFRIIVWGGAFTLFCLTAKRMDIPIYYAVIFLFASYVIIFSYARATAAMAIYFYGASYLYKPSIKHKTISIIWGLALIASSLLFHNSAIIMILMTTMLLIPLRKWIFLIIILLLESMTILLKDYFELIMYAEVTSEAVTRKMQIYTEGDETESGISGLIINFFQDMSLYVPFLICTIYIFKVKDKGLISTDVIHLFKITFGLILLATAFKLLGTDYNVFYYRILYMSMIPLAIIVPHLYFKCKMSHKYFMWCLYWGILFQLIRYTYSVYLILI